MLLALPFRCAALDSEAQRRHLTPQVPWMLRGREEWVRARLCGQSPVLESHGRPWARSPSCPCFPDQQVDGTGPCRVGLMHELHRSSGERRWAGHGAKPHPFPWTNQSFRSSALIPRMVKVRGPLLKAKSRDPFVPAEPGQGLLPPPRHPGLLPAEEEGVVLLTSEPAAAQLMRLLLGLAIQKVDTALRGWGRDRVTSPSGRWLPCPPPQA